jgi:hypothetical protein
VWIAKNEEISDEREELVRLGATIVNDVEQLIASSSSAVKMDFRHGVGVASRNWYGAAREYFIALSFVITDLGGSDESTVKTFIEDRLLEIFKDPTMMKRKVHWAFKVRRINGEKKKERKKRNVDGALGSIGEI